MNKFNLRAIIPVFILLVITLSSCQAIGDIFKAGVWVGILGVVIVVAIIFWLISRAGKK